MAMGLTMAGSSKALKTIPMHKFAFTVDGVEKFLPTMVLIPTTMTGPEYTNQARLPAASYYYRIDLDADGEVDMEGWIFISD